MKKANSNRAVQEIDCDYFPVLSVNDFGICMMLFKQITNSKSEKPESQYQPDFIPPQIKSVNTNQLEEPKQPPASVIENTTRTLSEIPE